MDWLWIFLIAYGIIGAVVMVQVALRLYYDIKRDESADSAVQILVPFVALMLGLFWPVVMMYWAIDEALRRKERKEKK